jgi:hypothetical protein
LDHIDVNLAHMVYLDLLFYYLTALYTLIHHRILASHRTGYVSIWNYNTQV